MLEQSCRRQGFDIHPHGVGQVFAGWSRCLMEYTLPHMRELLKAKATHVLFVDGIDTLAVGPLEEIEAKYKRLGSPLCLMSAESDAPVHNAEAFQGPQPWSYLNGGGYIAQIPLFVAMMEQLAKSFPNEGNYQVWLEQHYHRSGIVLDTDCHIFQSMDGHRSVKPMGDRVLNAVTGTWPCILHFRGGYCDPETGRQERMKPWLRELYGEKV